MVLTDRHTYNTSNKKSVNSIESSGRKSRSESGHANETDVKKELNKTRFNTINSFNLQPLLNAFYLRLPKNT